MFPQNEVLLQPRGCGKEKEFGGTSVL